MTLLRGRQMGTMGVLGKEEQRDYAATLLKTPSLQGLPEPDLVALYLIALDRLFFPIELVQSTFESL